MAHAHGPIEHDAPYVHLLAEPGQGIITILGKNYAPSGAYRATLDLAVVPFSTRMRSGW